MAKNQKNVNTKKVVYRGIAVGMAAVMGGVPVVQLPQMYQKKKPFMSMRMHPEIRQTLPYQTG